MNVKHAIKVVVHKHVIKHESKPVITNKNMKLFKIVISYNQSGLFYNRIFYNVLY